MSEAMMIEAARAITKFSEAMAAVLDKEARRIGETFANRHRSQVESISWSKHDNGDSSIGIELANGEAIRGRGDGKLEALLELERALAMPFQQPPARMEFDESFTTATAASTAVQTPESGASEQE